VASQNVLLFELIALMSCLGFKRMAFG